MGKGIDVGVGVGMGKGIDVSVGVGMSKDPERGPEQVHERARA